MIFIIMPVVAFVFVIFWSWIWSIGSDKDEPKSKLTYLSRAVNAYMGRDALDPTSTITFLMEVDEIPIDKAFTEYAYIPPYPPAMSSLTYESY